MNFLQDQGVETMVWPACSPDMNPIENLWAEVTHRINILAHQPTNVHELHQAVMDAWADIPVNILRTLVGSMPRRVQALRIARGRNTKY